MNFARGLLNDPWILFLDEPTLGLDVAAARPVRELVLAWKAAVPGRTVLLTTHYMAEADELCERIAIVDHGRILAIGTPDELKRRVQRESIFRLELDRLDGGPAAPGRLPGVVVGRGRRASAGGRRSPDRRPSTSSSPMTARWARSSARSAASGRTSSPSRSRSRPRGRLRRARRPRLRRGRGRHDVERDGTDHDDRDDPPAPDRTPEPRDTAHEPGEREEHEAVV